MDFCDASLIKVAIDIDRHMRSIGVREELTVKKAGNMMSVEAGGRFVGLWNPEKKKMMLTELTKKITKLEVF